MNAFAEQTWISVRLEGGFYTLAMSSVDGLGYHFAHGKSLCLQESLRMGSRRPSSAIPFQKHHILPCFVLISA